MTAIARSHWVAGVLRADDSIVLCHRRSTPAVLPDTWDLPGGQVKPGEEAHDAISRELNEELGIVVHVSSEPHVSIDGGDRGCPGSRGN
jgi:8-oxo-dGTP diphosphatase